MRSGARRFRRRRFDITYLSMAERCYRENVFGDVTVSSVTLRPHLQRMSEKLYTIHARRTLAAADGRWRQVRRATHFREGGSDVSDHDLSAAATAAPGAHGTARLDRPTPEWYDDAKLGIFVHWGLYSVPGWATTTGTLDEAGGRFGWETWFRENAYAEWYLNTLRITGSPTAGFHQKTYGDAPYEAFAGAFDAANKDWDAAAFAAIVKDAGAKYVVLTSKHHDGFCLWPSRIPNPVKGDYHAARDLVGDMAAAVRAEGIRFSTYYSGGLDWTMNPEPITDRREVGGTVLQDPVAATYFDAHWRELIERYDQQAA